MKKLLFIYNTHAGKGRVKMHLATIQAALCAAGWQVTIHPTTGAGDATRITVEVGEEYERIVCSGGDGTLHEVVEGLLTIPPEKRPPIGYIPMGTTNDFAKNLQLPRSVEEQAVVAAGGVPKAVDVGRFNDRCFVYIAAFGAFTDVSYNTSQEFKSLFGHLAYVLEAATRLGSIMPYTMQVEHDDGVFQGDFIYGMISNTISVGGFKGMADIPVYLDDGLFEVVLVRQPKNPVQLQSMLRKLLQVAPTEDDVVLSFRSSRVRITCEQSVPWTLDGEYGGDQTQPEIVNDSCAVTMIHGA